MKLARPLVVLLALIASILTASAIVHCSAIVGDRPPIADTGIQLRQTMGKSVSLPKTTIVAKKPTKVFDDDNTGDLGGEKLSPWTKPQLKQRMGLSLPKTTIVAKKPMKMFDDNNGLMLPKMNLVMTRILGLTKTHVDKTKPMKLSDEQIAEKVLEYVTRIKPVLKPRRTLLKKVKIVKPLSDKSGIVKKSGKKMATRAVSAVVKVPRTEVYRKAQAVQALSDHVRCRGHYCRW